MRWEVLRINPGVHRRRKMADGKEATEANFKAAAEANEKCKDHWNIILKFKSGYGQQKLSSCTSGAMQGGILWARG